MRLLLKILAIAAIGAALLIAGGYFLVPPAARTALADGSRAAFGVSSTIGGVGASPGMSTTSIGFTDYRLEAPPGFTEPVLSIGRFALGVGTPSLLDDTKEVSHFVLEDLVLTLEQDGLKTNLVPVIEHVMALMPDEAESSAQVDLDPDGGVSEPSPSGPRLRVGRVQVRGIAARLKLAGIPGIEPFDRTLTVPDFVEDFRRDGGAASIPEIAGTLVLSLKRKALEAADGEVPGEVLSALEAALDGALDAGLEGVVDGLESAAKGTIEAGTEALKDAASEALRGRDVDPASILEEGVGGLLGGKKDGR